MRVCQPLVGWQKNVSSRSGLLNSKVIVLGFNSVKCFQSRRVKFYALCRDFSSAASVEKKGV